MQTVAAVTPLKIPTDRRLTRLEDTRTHTHTHLVSSSYPISTTEMPTLEELVEAPTANGVNGSETNGHARTPSLTALALTEYSANPSPPSASDDSRKRIKQIIPEEFLLPNGNPDVCMKPIYVLCHLESELQDWMFNG